MKLKYYISSLLFFCLNISSPRSITPQMKVNPSEGGVSSPVSQGAGNVRNYIDHGKYPDDLNLAYKVGGKSYAAPLIDTSPWILSAVSDKIQIF